MIIGILIGLVIAAGLYLFLSGDKPAKVARSIFERNDSVKSDEN